MDPKIRSLVNRDKVIFYIDTNIPDVLHTALKTLGFSGEPPTNGFGYNYRRETPHEEVVNYHPIEESCPIYVNDRDLSQFRPCYELWNTCYSRVDDCPVGEEILIALVKRELKIAVFDYDSICTSAILIENDK